MVVNNSFIINALRNCGYTNYSAIADIVDNSIEQNVRVTNKNCFPFVKITTIADKVNSPITKILIIDNGVGMNEDILHEAMSLGSNTGKDPSIDLGCYGTGLKAAAFSIGQILEVFTKETNGELYHSKISLKAAIENNNNVEVEFDVIDKTSDYYKFFETYVGRDKANTLHGTIVAISELDRITANNEQFSNRLKYEIADIFNQFIKGKVVDFYINDKKVIYTDFIDSGIEISSGTKTVKDVDVTFKCYDMSNADYHERSSKDYDSNGHYLLDDKSTHYIVNTSAYNAGLYIYRQNRLVGKALKFNVIGTGDGYTQTFRCEIFIDGNSDSLFNTAFNKMISEKEKSTMCIEMDNFLNDNIKPIADQLNKVAHNRTNAAKLNDPEEVKVLNRVKNSANKNNMLSIQRDNGINRKPNIGVIPHAHRGPQANPNPIRMRHDKWFGGFSIESLGAGGNYCLIIRTENNGRKLYSVKINSDHKFYTEFFNKLDDAAKFKYGQILVCETLARETMNYWRDDAVKEYFDQYDEFITGELCKVL